MLNRRQASTALVASPLAVSSANAEASVQYKINEIIYPQNVIDEKSFNDWIDSIKNKEFLTEGKEEFSYSPISRMAIYREDDSKTLVDAKRIVYQSIANELFSRLVAAPNAKLSILFFGTYFSDKIIPSGRFILDSEVTDKKITLSPTNWNFDFNSLTHVELKEPKGIWKKITGYMRYAIVKEPDAIVVSDEGIIIPNGWERVIRWSDS